MDLVSVIMPSFNTGKYIKESINSVIDQTYYNFELIIVDDHSTDNTVEILSKLNDKRIKYIINEKNYGAAYCRNLALKMAKGEWIAFLDSDDLWEKDKLYKQISFMKKNDYNFSYTNYVEIDEHSNDLNTMVTGPKCINEFGMYNYCWMGCLTVMYNASDIGIIQIESLKKNNDYAMWLKICKKSKCYLLNENLAKYRKRKGSISNHSYLKLIKWHYTLFRYADDKSSLESIVLTIRNMFFGVLKKLFYVKKIR